MKKQILIPVLGIAVALLLAGTCSASPGTDEGANPVYTARPVTLVDARETMTIWSSASNAVVNVASIPDCYILNYSNTIRFYVPGGGTEGYLLTPFTIPCKMNGKACSIRYVYLQWMGYSDFTISWVEVWSGNTQLRKIYLYRPGTGAEETVTVDLEGYYPVTRGLNLVWAFQNNQALPNFTRIYGYGTTIRYKVS